MGQPAPNVHRLGLPRCNLLRDAQFTVFGGQSIVNTFFDEHTCVGIGVGPYVYIDRKHPVDHGTILGRKNPAAVAPLVSLSVARHLSEDWLVRVVWDRVTTSYNRDADVFLLGLGYRWR